MVMTKKERRKWGGIHYRNVILSVGRTKGVLKGSNSSLSGYRTLWGGKVRLTLPTGWINVV